jgi:S-formylglutathione hydrolase
VITPNVAPWGFYLDDPQRGSAWESFVARRLLCHLQGTAAEPQVPVGIVGISMGGYGALKMALCRPQAFRAVAAIAPMVEPAFAAQKVRPRNRYHYPPEVPAALLGPSGADRDASLYAADHPAGRAVRHAEALRTGALAIYLDAGTADALNAHDGAEFLHRVLWDLDVPHDYRLWEGADHVGPSLVPRLEAALVWVGGKLAPVAVPLTPLEVEWQQWIERGGTGPMPPPFPPTSSLMPRLLRMQLAPTRAIACREDETMNRSLGILPPSVLQRQGPG